MQYFWEKPVITFYKESFGNPEKEPFVAVKGRRLLVYEKDEGTKLVCVLTDFFPIMGNLDYISTQEGKNDKYVLCWFDDQEDDFGKAFRRMTSVTFKEGIKCKIDKKGKITCNANFEARVGKLN